MRTQQSKTTRLTISTSSSSCPKKNLTKELNKSVNFEIIGKTFFKYRRWRWMQAGTKDNQPSSFCWIFH